MVSLTYLLLTAAGAYAQGTQSQSSSSFQLWVYAPELGGLPLFYADGLAYAGDPNLSNSTQAAVVTFTPANEKVWSGAPNKTGLDSSKSPIWSNKTFYIPAAGASSSRVGFANSSIGTGIETSGFMMYGSNAMFISNDGTLESSWTGLKNEDGIYSLHWNDTSQGQVPLALRKIAPSTPPQHPSQEDVE